MRSASRMVRFPRKQALTIARYERDSLRARQRTSIECSEPWKNAADEASRVVAQLEAGDDAQAAMHAMQVGPKWHIAADCEGWPTPERLGNPGAKNGEVNFHLFDRYTAAHFATGIGLGVMRLSFFQALAFAVVWEIVETPLKRAVPQVFPYSSEDTLTNAAGDVIGMMAGWGVWQLLALGKD